MKKMTETSKHSERSRDRLAVLIADDDPAQRQELIEYLTHLGIDVIEAEDGIEAVAQIDRCRPALAVMDIRLPQGDTLDGQRRAGNAVNEGTSP